MNDHNNHNVRGQATLPTMEQELGYGAITSLRPRPEKFCWEFVLRNSNCTAAYMAAYPGSKQISANANGCRLLKNAAIQTRIVEIRDELRRRYSVNASMIVQLLSMSAQMDRRQFIDADGKPVELHNLDSEAAAIVDLEIVVDRNGVKQAVIRVPERIKAAVELAKLMGLSKERIEVSGPDGAAIYQEAPVVIYVPDNGRDKNELLVTTRTEKKGEE